MFYLHSVKYKYLKDLTYVINCQEKVEWIEEPVDKTVKQGTVDEVTFTCKLSVKGKKAKWYIRNQVCLLFKEICIYIFHVIISAQSYIKYKGLHVFVFFKMLKRFNELYFK